MHFSRPDAPTHYIFIIYPCGFIKWKPIEATGRVYFFFFVTLFFFYIYTQTKCTYAEGTSLDTRRKPSKRARKDPRRTLDKHTLKANESVPNNFTIRFCIAYKYKRASSTYIASSSHPSWCSPVWMYVNEAKANALCMCVCVWNILAYRTIIWSSRRGLQNAHAVYMQFENVFVLYRLLLLLVLVIQWTAEYYYKIVHVNGSIDTT